MKRIDKLMLILFFVIVLSGCNNKKQETGSVVVNNELIQPTEISTESSNLTDPIIEPESPESGQVTKVSWKTIGYGGWYFHLYAVINEETEYYIDYFSSEDFLLDTVSTDEEYWNAEGPENALTYFGGIQEESIEWFYMYRKNDTELAVMSHSFEHDADWNNQQEYEEILVIPIEENSQIQIEEPVIIQKEYYWANQNPIVYNGTLIGGTRMRYEWIPNEQLEFETALFGDMGYRLFENGQYLDTVSVPDRGFSGNNVDIQYNGERFQGLAVNNRLPLHFGEKISLSTSTQLYQDYIAQILTESGLGGEPVHINQLIQTDIDCDGEEEVLIVASNLNTENKTNGQYSIVVLRKIIDGNPKSIFLIRDIVTNPSTNSSDRPIYKYNLCEVVDLNYDGVYELLIKREYDGNDWFQVYQLTDNKFGIVIENGDDKAGGQYFPTDDTATKPIGNARFNFWITIPSNWNMFNPSENGDGYSIECGNETIDMRAYGSEDILSEDYYLDTKDGGIVSEFIFDNGVSGWQITKENHYSQFLYKSGARYITFYVNYERDVEWFNENQNRIISVAKTLRDGQK